MSQEFLEGVQVNLARLEANMLGVHVTKTVKSAQIPLAAAASLSPLPFHKGIAVVVDENMLSDAWVIFKDSHN